VVPGWIIAFGQERKEACPPAMKSENQSSTIRFLSNPATYGDPAGKVERAVGAAVEARRLARLRRITPAGEDIGEAVDFRLVIGRHRFAGGWKSMGPWLVLVLVSTALCIALYPWIKNQGEGATAESSIEKNKSAPPVHYSELFNYSFQLPNNWTLDPEVKKGLKANLLAMHGDHSDSWLALAAREFKDRVPAPDTSTGR
jgi:hypothetical protein